MTSDETYLSFAEPLSCPPPPTLFQDAAFLTPLRVTDEQSETWMNSKLVTQISICYHCDELIPLTRIEHGDWIDLRAAENVTLKKGEAAVISLGVSMKLPEGYEAHVVPRSSTFKTWGVIQTNGVGIIDNSYCGTNDIWMMPVYATRDTEIHVNDRICQFRIVRKQPDIDFVKQDALEDNDRGGFGSTEIN